MSTVTVNLTPADTEWHDRRREVYTASDMGVLFGLPGFGKRTLSDVWYEKRFGVKPSQGNESTRLGNRLESVVLDEAEEHIGPIVNRQRWVAIDNIGATLDGQAKDKSWRPVEAKTSGILWKPDEEWGDTVDEIPSAITLQVMCQIYLCGTDTGLVPALIGGRGFKLYEIPRHDGLIAEMQRRVASFIESLKSDTAPENPPQLDTLKRLRRQPNKVMERSDEIDELWDRLEAAKSVAKSSNDAEEGIKRQLLAKLQDAEAVATHGGLITYFEQHNKEQYRAANSFRVLRLQKGK